MMEVVSFVLSVRVLVGLGSWYFLVVSDRLCGCRYARASPCGQGIISDYSILGLWAMYLAQSRQR
jgi:hypothetical protein